MLKSVRSLAGARNAAVAHPAPRAAARSHAAGADAALFVREASALPARRSALLRWSSTKAKPLGLKDGASDLGLSPTMKMIGGYITVSMTAMVVIARYKDRNEADEEVCGAGILSKMRCCIAGFPLTRCGVGTLYILECTRVQYGEACGGERSPFLRSDRVPEGV